MSFICNGYLIVKQKWVNLYQIKIIKKKRKKSYWLLESKNQYPQSKINSSFIIVVCFSFLASTLV